MSKQPFYVGQEVVCIDDDWNGNDIGWGRPLPKKGQVFFVKSIDMGEQGWQIDIGLGEYNKFYTRRFAPIERTRINYVVKEVEVDTEIREKAKETILETTQTN